MKYTYRSLALLGAILSMLSFGEANASQIGVNSASDDLPIGAAGNIFMTMGTDGKVYFPVPGAGQKAFIDSLTGQSSFEGGMTINGPTLQAKAIYGDSISLGTGPMAWINSTGEASFVNNKIHLNADGSAVFANNLIHFNADGSAVFANNLTHFNNDGSGVFGGPLVIDNAGPLTSADVTTLNAIRVLGPCATNQAITKTNVGYACVAVTNLLGVGTVTVPSCPATQQLYFTGSGFTCTNLPVPPAPPALPTCPPNKLLGFDSGGAYTCVNGPTPGGQPVFVYTAAIVGASNYNAAINNAKATFCYPSASAAYCDALYGQCYLDTAGTDGSAGDNDHFVSVTSPNNVVCGTAFCQGKAGKTPAFTYLAGVCGPGQTDVSSGNPACDPSGRPLISMNCMTTY